MRTDCSLAFEKDKQCLIEEVSKSRLVGKKLVAKSIKNAFCLPPTFNGKNFLGGVFDHNKQYVKESGFYSDSGGWYQWPYSADEKNTNS